MQYCICSSPPLVFVIFSSFKHSVQLSHPAWHAVIQGYSFVTWPVSSDTQLAEMGQEVPSSSTVPHQDTTHYRAARQNWTWKETRKHLSSGFLGHSAQVRKVVSESGSVLEPCPVPGLCWGFCEFILGLIKASANCAAKFGSFCFLFFFLLHVVIKGLSLERTRSLSRSGFFSYPWEHCSTSTTHWSRGISHFWLPTSFSLHSLSFFE